MPDSERKGTVAHHVETRRNLIKKMGRVALAAPPAVTIIMAASGKPAKAAPPYWAPANGYRERTGDTDWIGYPGSRGDR